jgi:hypothetical protein
MRDPSRPWTRQQSFFRIVRSGREALRNGKQRENSPKPQGILRGRGFLYKHGTHSMNKECVCSPTVLTIEYCGRCTGSAGGPSAGAASRKYGRPAAEESWKEKACTQAKRWGECPADRRSAAPVASSLFARSARPTSCPRRRPQNTTPRWVKKESKKSNRVEKLCRRGDTGDATRPTGENCANAQ